MSRIKTEATGAGQPECLRHDSHHTGGPEPSRGSPTPPGCRLTPGPGSHLLLGPEGGRATSRNGERSKMARVGLGAVDPRRQVPAVALRHTPRGTKSSLASSNQVFPKPHHPTTRRQGRPKCLHSGSQTRRGPRSPWEHRRWAGWGARSPAIPTPALAGLRGGGRDGRGGEASPASENPLAPPASCLRLEEF